MLLGKKLSLVNIYGPYNAKKEYWDAFFECDFLKKHYIIVGSDFNFVEMRYGEKWIK
jgi:hypothetical protein